MPKKLIVTYLLIVAILLATMSLSRHGDAIRGGLLALLAPLGEKGLSLKHFILHPTQPSPLTSLSPEEEIQQLKMEKELLEKELAHWRQQLQEQLLSSSKIAQIASFSPDEARRLSEEHRKAMKKILQVTERRVQAVPARVIFHSLDRQSCSLWINAGHSCNSPEEPPLVALNSPVVVGNAIVGILDYVGTHQSRVRLITDNRLNPSVRSSRGGEQQALISEQIDRLLAGLKIEKALPLSPDEQTRLVQLLERWQSHLHPLKKNWYLAKGILLGSAGLSGNELRGSGFNYDFADEEGEGRDLLTGAPLSSPQRGAIPILKIHDLLVTTGMDGLFPPGFQVAVVTRVEPLKEGDYCYELRAKPIVGRLEGFSLVFILPPVSPESKFSE